MKPDAPTPAIPTTDDERVAQLVPIVSSIGLGGYAGAARLAARWGIEPQHVLRLAGEAVGRCSMSKDQIRRELSEMTVALAAAMARHRTRQKGRRT